MAGAGEIEIPEYAPDLTALGTNVSSVISGVVPHADGYGPFKSLIEFTKALPAACRGYFFARRSDGSIAIFAGTIDRLYRLNNTTFAWEDISNGGVAYPALLPGDNWRFAQFNDLVIVVQVGVVPQKYTLATDTGFVDLLGSPPQASHIAIINRFVVLTGLQSANRRVHWSDLGAPEVWTAGVGFSDFQDLPDGGTVHGISGGDAYGVVFQDEPIRTFTYQPGSATVFQIAKVSENDPLKAQYSVVQSSDRTFCILASGIKMLVGSSSQPVPIGKERVDRFFAGDVDESNLQLVQGAADPTATRVYFAYKSKAGNAGLFDKVLCFDWSIGKAGRWSLLPLSGQYLTALARPGLTLEQLDAIAPTPLDITGAADNGAGLIRLTLSALSNADFTLGSVADGPSQNFITVYGVTGTVEANATWAYTIVDATHIDLTGSAFVNAYVAGGHIGGSLDALPFSLDSISTSSIAALSAMSENNAIGFFTGDNIEAILETGEQDLQGTCVFVEAMRPMTDSPDVMMSCGTRMTAQEAIVYTGENGLGIDGCCPIEAETRYAKARMRIPAASDWTYARSVQPIAQPAGEL